MNNWKSEVNIFHQRQALSPPTYNTHREGGPDHQPIYKSKINSPLGKASGRGESKIKAEQNAAHNLMIKLNKQDSEEDRRTRVHSEQNSLHNESQNGHNSSLLLYNESNNGQMKVDPNVGVYAQESQNHQALVRNRTKNKRDLQSTSLRGKGRSRFKDSKQSFNSSTTNSSIASSSTGFNHSIQHRCICNSYQENRDRPQYLLIDHELYQQGIEEYNINQYTFVYQNIYIFANSDSVQRQRNSTSNSRTYIISNNEYIDQAMSMQIGLIIGRLSKRTITSRKSPVFTILSNNKSIKSMPVVFYSLLSEQNCDLLVYEDCTQLIEDLIRLITN